MNWTSSAPVHPESAQIPLDRAASAAGDALGEDHERRTPWQWIADGAGARAETGRRAQRASAVGEQSVSTTSNGALWPAGLVLVVFFSVAWRAMSVVGLGVGDRDRERRVPLAGHGERRRGEKTPWRGAWSRHGLTGRQGDDGALVQLAAVADRDGHLDRVALVLGREHVGNGVLGRPRGPRCPWSVQTDCQGGRDTAVGGAAPDGDAATAAGERGRPTSRSAAGTAARARARPIGSREWLGACSDSPLSAGAAPPGTTAQLAVATAEGRRPVSLRQGSEQPP